MQKKNKFDKTTIKKITKGALIAGTGTFGLYFLNALGQIDYGDNVTPIVAALIPILVNAFREWHKGN